MEKKVIVVTGATGGIGQKVVEKLCEQNYTVLTTSRNEEKLKSLYEEKQKCYILPWNLANIDSIFEFCNLVKEEYGAIDGLVHCAGIGIGHGVNIIKPRIIKELFAINTFAGIMLTSIFSKKSMHKQGSSFVLISSIAAHTGTQGQSVYSATKGALEGFIYGSASELTEKGIRINAIAPGLVMTDMVANHYKKIEEKTINNFKDGYPLGLIEPEDIAECVKYLISEDSKRITGQTIILDGGFMIRKP